ncbi:MAG: DUF1569 domain-containing protein [Bryobacteraceae bacterium]
MKTLWDDTARASLMTRFEALSADSKPKWGKFNAPQMVQHCLGSIRAFLDELTLTPPTSSILKVGLIRHAVIYWLPFPKGAPTAPELLAPPEGDFPALVGKLRDALGRIAERNRQGPFSPHPAFGQLTNDDVGVLIHKHLNHHLDQFGK